MRTLKVALWAFVVWAAVSAASAQTGGLKVVVLDGADKSPLPGAVVTLSHGLGYVKETSLMSDANGVVMFPVLRAGEGYRVQVIMGDYSPYDSGPEIRVKIGSPQTWQVQLIQVLKEVVKVVGKTEVVSLEENQSSTTFGSEFIQDLPVAGRFYQNVLTLAPGVDDANNDGNPNVHGARERDFKANVSGVSNQDPLTGQFLSLVNPDSIEEIEVVTAGAGVEYGGAQGGYANIVQKQGSNDFEGVANFLFRSSKLDGNGATNISTRDLPDFKAYQPSVQVSGPILRDKLWYRLSHEYHYIDTPVNTIGQVAIVQERRRINDDLITWQASPRNKLQFQYRSDPQSFDNLGVSSLRPPESAQRFEVTGPDYVFTWDAPFSTNLLIKSIVAYQDKKFNFLPTSAGVQNTCLGAAQGVAAALGGAYCVNNETGEVSGSFFRTWRDERQRLTVRSEGEFFGTKLWGFDQRIKFGFHVENERYARTLSQNPVISFFQFTPVSETEGQAGDLDPVGIALTNFTVPQSTFGRSTGVKYALYASDQINLLSNLTTTVGLRLDYENVQSKGFQPFDPAAESARYDQLLAEGMSIFEVPRVAFTAYEGVSEDLITELARILGVDPGSVNVSPLARELADWPNRRRLENINLNNTNLSPYLAFAWDPFKDGKSKISGTLRRQFGNIILAIPLTETDPASFFSWITTQNIDGRPVITDLGSVDPTGADITIVDRGLKTPYQDEISLALERELWQETSIKVQMIKRRFKDQLQDIDINHAPGDYGRCVASGAGGFIVESSPGTGSQLIDPYSGETYTDTVEGGGDGRLDDCVGKLIAGEPEEGQNYGPGNLFPIPDGLPDTYILNPSFGSVYLLGNYNTIDYTAYVLELVRRQYRGWQMEASYTWSRAIGDAEDYNQIEGDDRTTAQDERGFLSYDRRHAVKVNATTITPWGFRLGGAVQWLSGLPYSIIDTTLATDSIPPNYSHLLTRSQRERRVYPTHQRNDQRNRSYWNFDVNAAREFNLKGGLNLQLRAEIFNLFNKDTLFVLQNRDSFNFQVRDFGRRFQISTRLAF
jgi:outer membrane receptor protein involved in Fe transport